MSTPSDQNSNGGWSLTGDPDPAGGAAPSSTTERYQLRNLIGRGGMGVVRIARDQVVGREVAIKELDPDTQQQPQQALRLAREAAITGRLDHPGIIAVHDIGQHPDGRQFYTMRLVRGRSLADALSGTPVAPERRKLLRSLLAVTEAVAAAHHAGIVHRDLKPANILLGPFGETQVVDWGLAAPTAAAAAAWQDLPGSTPLGRVGTPGYMAPEQGEMPDPRHDVYSLGVILFELLAGGRPGTPVPEDTPADLLAIAQHAMGPKRYPDAQAMAEDLAAWFEGRRVGVHPYRASELLLRLVRLWRAPLLVGLLGVLAVIGVVLIGLWRTTLAKDQALAAEAVATEARTAAEKQLARTWVEQAVVALGRSNRARAETLAVKALNHENDPTAWGVLAAYGLARRPRLLSEEAGPTCAWSVLGDGFLICGGDGKIGRWEAGRFSWQIAQEATGGTLVSGGLTTWDGAGRVTLLDIAGGQILAQSLEQVHVWTTISFPRRVFLDKKLWPADEHAPPPPCALLQQISVGPELASICTDGTLLIGPPENPSRLRVQTGLVGDQGASDLAWVGNDRLVVGGLRGALHLLDARTGAVLNSIQTDLGLISRIAATADLVAVRGIRASIGLWDVQSGTWLGEIPAKIMPSFRWTDSGDLMVFDGVLRRWSPGGRTLVRATVGAGIADVVISPDEKRIAAGAGNGGVTVFRREDGAMTEQYALGDLVIKGISFFPGGLLATSVQRGGSWRIRDGVAQLLPQMRGQRRIAAFSDGEVLATDLLDGLVRYPAFDSAPERLLFGRVYLDMEREPDSQHVVLLDEHGNVLRYDRQTQGMNLLFSSSNVRSVASIGSLVATNVGHEVLLYTDAGQLVYHLSTGQPDAFLTDVAMAPQGPLIAAGSEDGRIFVWDGAAGKLIAIMPGHTEKVSTLEFTRDNNLVSGSWDHSLRVWDLGILKRDPVTLRAEIFQDFGLTSP